VVRPLTIVILMCAAVGLVRAQGGSNYSALGVGDLRTTIGAVYDGMAGTTISMPTPYGINIVNPALQGMATTTRLQGGYRFNQTVINETDGRSLAQNNGELDGLIAMFSVDTAYGFGITFGVLPYSSIAYAVARDISTTIDSSVITGRSEQTGKGGTSMLQIGSSVRLFNSLYVGLSVSGLFGVLTYEDLAYASSATNRVLSSQVYDMRGFLFRAGAMWQVTDWLNVGGYVAGGPDATLFITQNAAGVSSSGVTFDTSIVSERPTSLPVQWGLGLSTPVGKGRFGVDLEVLNFMGVQVNVRPDAGYAPGYRMSLGLFQPGNITGSYFNRIGWQTGLSARKLYVTFQDQDLYEFLGSGGLSLPVGGNAIIDGAVQLGWRGPFDGRSLTEFVGRLTVTVSIGETWFKPFARD